MTPTEVLDIARAGEKLGCTEALFTLGERPELRYPEAKKWLFDHGYKTTIDYLNHMCELILQETSLFPHGNPGTMSGREMLALKQTNVSMGVMLENISPRLSETGGPHALAPSKWPKARLKTIKKAGELRIPFTTGILIGIGETKEERIRSLIAIRDAHDQYGHIQEVIIQNFRSKSDIPMRLHEEPTTDDLLWTVAVARIILGPKANIQVPPNLNSKDYPVFLLAGINDWGGVSPLTIDFVNPEAPWPQLPDLLRNTAKLGFNLKPRLPLYPEYIIQRKNYLPKRLENRVKCRTDRDGYIKGGIERYV
jgi:FO synthase